MAMRILDSLWVRGKGLVTLVGSFAPNSTGAVSATSNKGRGWSVARTSAGLFTITFTDKWNALISANATLQLASADDKYVQIGVYTAASKTLQIRILDISGAAVADVSADANNRVNFEVVFSNSTLPNRGK